MAVSMSLSHALKGDFWLSFPCPFLSHSIRLSCSVGTLCSIAKTLQAHLYTNNVNGRKVSFAKDLSDPQRTMS